MKRSRFSEERIIGILKEHQAGAKGADLCRKHGISDATFYKWRSKYGGMEVSDAKRLKALEAENAKLKKLLAEQMMDVATLKEMLGKTSEALFTAQGRGLGHEEEGYTQRRACALAGIDPRVYRRGPKMPRDKDLRERPHKPSAERRRFGHRRLHILLKREGWHVNWKKLYRIYKEEGLSVR